MWSRRQVNRQLLLCVMRILKKRQQSQDTFLGEGYQRQIWLARQIEEGIESVGKLWEGLASPAARFCSERPVWPKLKSEKEMQISQVARRPWVTSHSHWCPRGAVVVLAWQARGPENYGWPPHLLLISHLVWGAGVGIVLMPVWTSALVGLRDRTKQPDF